MVVNIRVQRRLCICHYTNFSLNFSMTWIHERFPVVSTVLIALVGAWFGAHSGDWLITTLEETEGSLPLKSSASSHQSQMTHSLDTQPRPTTISYLLLGIDDSSQDSPRLEAVWLATIVEDYTSVQMTGIIPNEHLQNAFAEGYGHIETILSHQTQAPIVSRIVLHYSDFAQIADLLGGLRLGGKTRNGLSVLDYVVEPQHQDERLLRQAAVVQAMVAAAVIHSERFQIEGLLEQIRDGQFGADEFTALARNHSQLHTQQVIVRIAPEIETVSGERT